MSKATVYSLLFLLGAVCGAAASYRFFEIKFKQIADEEIESVKKVFAKRNPDINEHSENKEATPDKKEERIHSANKRVTVDYSLRNKHSAAAKQIYPITAEQFGEFDDYDKISLVLFADDVITDEDYKKITPGSLNIGESFSVCEDEDSFYIRNDDTEADYEIIRDERTYEELCLDRPYLRED